MLIGYIKKKNENVEVTISAFWIVVLIHSLHNSIAVIASQL